MKNYAKQTQMEAKDNARETAVRSAEVVLFVEELEQVIAPISSVRR
jgi:hypothetical protein